MRHALIIAGGSGTRLWPMSRESAPKQLLPFINGNNLVQIAAHRLEGLVPPARRHICAASRHETLIRQSLPELGPSQFLGEPCGRDTLNAVGFSAAIIALSDPDAVIAVFTADHIIEPIADFLKIVETGFRVAEQNTSTLVTFGITPTHAATSYGYLQLGADAGNGARQVEQFKEKPELATATQYFNAGPSRYLWNSGMFVWRASTLLDCIRRYHPENFTGLSTIAAAWNTPDRNPVLERVYPTLKKISVDFAVMEPASRDPAITVAAVPMPLSWLDVGSWPSFAQTCSTDANHNAIAAGKSLLLRSSGNLVASSDPNHLVSLIGCNNLIVIHTPEATLICPADQAEAVKEAHQAVSKQFGPPYV
jgi:mannose-1-phosphate guanylyltransferase